MTQKLNSSNNGTKTIKFLYSYGGKIVLRPIDGKLLYVGGDTRVLSVDHSVTYSELMVKFRESCGSSMNMTCKLPSEDLDVLVSIKSDEELRSVIEEYERSARETKIRAVLFAVRSAKKVSQPSSPMSCLDFPSTGSAKASGASRPSVAVRCAYAPFAAVRRCSSPAVGYPIVAGKNRYYQARTYRLPIRNCLH